MKKILIIKLCIFLLMFGSHHLTKGQIQVINPSEDSYVRGGSHKDENYDQSSDELYVKQGNVSDFFRKAFVMFNIDSVDLEKVESAVLKLYCYEIQNKDFMPHVSVYETSSEWSETVITWNNAPDFVSFIGFEPVQLGTYIEVDVSDYVVGGINSKIDKISFGLYDGAASNNGFRFHDKLGEHPP